MLLTPGRHGTPCKTGTAQKPLVVGFAMLALQDMMPRGVCTVHTKHTFRRFLAQNPTMFVLISPVVGVDVPSKVGVHRQQPQLKELQGQAPNHKLALSVFLVLG